MNCEVVAVGSELLLGSNVDTNSTWIGEQLAAHGITSYFHTVVGDNRARIVETLRIALSRSDAVIVTGGLGPTQDDITRQAIAEVMDVELVSDPQLEQGIREIFARRQRSMSPNNLQQAMRPVGSQVIEQNGGTAPGLICPCGDTQVIYALPGVPSEMKEMSTRAVLPDLQSRSGEQFVIVSRYVKTWGLSESALAELVTPRVEALEALGNPTIAFLAHGIDGIYLRLTARGMDAESANVLLDAEEKKLRAVLSNFIFGLDDESMESAVGKLLSEKQWTLGVSESLTGGLIAMRLTSVPGTSQWFRGGIVSYAADIKFSLLDVPKGPVVTAEAAKAMAIGARRALSVDVGLGITGVAGPAKQENQPVGTVFGAIALPSGEVETFEFQLNGDRQRIREYSCINILDALRRKLIAIKAN